MATHSYPEGQDPSEVFREDIAKHTSPKTPDMGAAGAGEDQEPHRDTQGEDADRLVQEYLGEYIRDGLQRGNVELPVMTGVQYVVGQAPRAPVLRPMNQPIYYKAVLHEGDTEIIAFCEAVGQRRHTGAVYTPDVTMTYADTNMACAGQLGMPIEFALKSVAIHPTAFGEAYFRQWNSFLSASPVFRWEFGQGTNWLTLPVQLMEPRLPGPYNENTRFPRTDRGVADLISRIAQDTPLPRYADIGNPLNGYARHIVSTESFLARISFPNRQAWMGEDFSFYVVMHGTFYGMVQ